MTISTRVNRQLGSIRIYGKFDFHAYREFKSACTDVLSNPAIHEIEVEMQHLDYLDSAALGMLVLLRERARAANKSIVLSNPSGRISKLLEFANFDKVFSMRRHVHGGERFAVGWVTGTA